MIKSFSGGTKMKNILKRTISFLLAANMALSGAVPALAFELEKIGEEISFSETEMLPEPEEIIPDEAAPEEMQAEEVPAPDFSGKKVSILSHSASTYAGVSNDTNANSTIGKNDVYYTEGRHGVYRKDTWWQQAADALGMEVLVNNSWSGSCVFLPRKGEASVTYGSRAVNLHNDHTGEEPEVIWVYIGGNDFAYYKDTFGKAEDVDYSAIITDNGDGTFSYAVPTTTCEAYVITLHKIQNRYPDAEIYCMTSTARRETDYTGDSYPDAGQPTEYCAELWKIAEDFGFPVVDLEKAIPKEIELFDKYMGDKRAHPNALGMDQITNEVLSVMLGEDAEIRHVTSESGIVKEQAVLLGGSYSSEVELPEGYTLSVVMDGKDVTEEVYSGGKILIEEVTGDIEITAKRGAKNFRWELENDVFVSVTENGFSENELTLLEGNISGGIFSGVKYSLADEIRLEHNKPWAIEWSVTGNWDATLFANTEKSGAKDSKFIFRSSTDYELLAMGEYDGTQYNNYGIATKELGLDMTKRHVYRLENRIAKDGSNMVRLYIDGKEIAPMNRHFIGSKKDTGNTSDWVSGKDFSFGYMGTVVRPINYCSLEYIEVFENGKPAETKQLVEGFDAVSSIEPGDSRLVDAHNTVSPLVFENLKLFENNAITALNLFVTGTVVDNDGTNKNDPEIEDNAEYTFDISVIDSSSVKAGGKYSVKKTYTLTVKGSEIRKNDWNTFDISDLGIVVEEGETLGFGSGTSSLEIFYINKNISSKLCYFGHNNTTGDTTLRLRTTSNLPIGVEGYSTKEPEIEDPKALKGKTLSILGASISTYAGTSNGAAADTTNSTIRNNAKYYPNNTVKDVALGDTWWMQFADDLGLRLLVNNSWSGGAILLERAGTVGAYVDRCVQLHDNTGENAGEDPDIIIIQKGFNDFSYGKSTLGTAEDINYEELILEDGYAEPKTTMEATVIMLDKMTKRYPDAEIYMFSHFKRVNQSAADTELMEKLNSSIETVCERYGIKVIDLYSVLGSVEFVGDGSVHPNRLGMDIMTEAAKRTVLANTAYEAETHLVSFELEGVSTDYGDDKIVISGDSFSVNLAAEIAGILEVSVTMGGNDITEAAYNDGKVSIEAVTGDVVIKAESVHEPKDYRWESDGTDLVCIGGENGLTKISGTTAGGVFSKTAYSLEEPVVLLHDKPWTVEWKCEGTFMNENGSTGARIFTSDNINANYNARYIFKSATKWLIAMGEKDSSGSHNYGIALEDHGIDGSALHTYRLENRIASDGSNMVYLFVDGKEIGALNNYYVGTTDKGTTSDWLSGKDFVFPYMGTDTHGFSNAKIDYIAVWENGEKTEPLSLRYDDRMDISGKTVEIVDAGKPTSYKVGYGVAEGTFDDAVITLAGEKLIATGIGTAKVRIDGILYEITAEKAKVNIVVIMGQSNAGNHFANATSDITCPPGTAYWWKNGATAPVDYTEPSMGFHTPLLAELYAQSTAAGDPVKNVMVWQEGVTSKNGQSIVKWAATETDTSGTDGTATMLKNCIAYYEQNSDKFEIVNSGIYWLQGESDVSMAPEKYTKLYMAMWNKLKEAGAEYVAFFRVRKGTNLNTAEHEDLDYTGSLTAQLDMINRNPDMFMATTITENWTGIETTEHSVDIRNYITLMAEYGKDGSYNDSYGNAATVENGILTTTMKTLYGSNNKCHYGKFGYGIIGADAAFNMYKAFGASDFSIVKTDSSGKASAQLISKPGEKVTLDITGLEENLAFRASCGSAAGTLSIKVESKSEDITGKVIAKETNTFGTFDTEILREYDDAVITVTYNPVSGTSGSVVYSIVDNTPEPPKMYFWDFENDLNARDENGEVVNSFGETALSGSYVLENGMLKGNALQLALEKQLKLHGDKNWSIEWKFGEVTESTTGFLLCNTAKSAVGTKAVYFSFVGNVMISDYKDSKGYYNYFTEETTFASGDCIKFTNTYDSENEKSVLSLWKNGKLIVSDLQKEGFINSSASGTYDMSAYPLSGDFVFNYLGCTGLQYFPVTGEIDYIRIIPEEEETEPLSLRYDDRYDVSGKSVEIVDAGKPTSYKVGYGVAEGTFDDAVVTLSGEKLIATGIGTAKVRIDGVLYEITVEASPISLLLLIGQSNMQGSEGDANQSIICPDGIVYSTYGDRYTMTVDNAANFAPSAIAGENSAINVNGTTDNIKDWPIYLLNEAGAGKIGPDSGFAYEWAKQTGEKVWVVNAAHGGTAINTWQDGAIQFEECERLFKACQETLRKEIAAGHYTLSHMGYFWCQGCSDAANTAEWYVKKYLSMHESLKTVLAFDHDSDSATENYTFEFGGIIPILYGVNSYRAGANKDVNNYPYYTSFEQLFFNGPRVAQYWMINNPELTDIWGVCNIGEDWVWMPDGTNGVSDYFNAHYENGTVDYTTQVAQKASWYKPTTPAAVHDSIHYNQIGYNEVGRESVRNALIMLGEIEAPETETTVELLSWNGYTEVSEVPASTTGNSGTLVVPKVYPLWEAKNVTFELSEGLRYNYYDLLANQYRSGGTLSANGKTVSVKARELGSYSWELIDGELVSVGERENPVTKIGGKTENGLFIDTRYQFKEPFALLHDENWVLEWKMSGSWVDAESTTSKKLFCEDGASATTGAMCLLVNGKSGFISIGYYGGTTHMSYGVYLAEYGIDITESHIYRLVNHIDEDGTNMIYLFVDGKQIAPMTRYITGSGGNMGTESDYLSGKDIFFGFMGTQKYSLDNGIIEYVSVAETGASSDIHFHDWSDWKITKEPSREGPGTEERECSGCGETETKEIEGVWQKYNLAAHYSDLPEKVCSGLNLWNVLPHDDEFITAGTHWAVHSTGKVYSVTFAVNGGDRIYATSFGKAGENGGSSNGIRMTFLDAYGMLKTLDPAGTHAEFTANGGYLVAPEGAIAVNIPMWNNSDENEIYLLDREHCYGEWVEVKAPACDAEGQDKSVCGGCGSEKYRKTFISGDSGKILVSNPLPEDYFAGKKIVTLGDSVTFGAFLDSRYTEAYPFVLGELLGATISNKAISGSCFCTGGKGSATVNQSLTAGNIKDADVVTIMLGINDFNHAVKDGIWQGEQKYDESVNYYGLGDINSIDTSEFYGAVRSWCEKIAEFRKTADYKDVQFVFITPTITSWNRSITYAKDWDQEKLNVYGHTLRQYCTAIMEVCAEYDIPVFDANMFSGIYYNSPEDNNVDVTGGDGVHPSPAGHRLIAESLAKFLLGGYSYEERAVANCGHSYVDEVVAPSCEEEGYTIHRCPECHNRYIDSYVPAAGHSFENGICTVCGEWKYSIGDINLDGEVNVKDAYYARLVAAKLIKPTDEQRLVGDVDLDGRITALDANIIRKFVAHLIEKLPVTG